MKELMIFNNPKFGEIRTVMINNRVYFVGADVTKALGYSNGRDALMRHCKGVVKHDTLTNGGKQEMSVIPEGDIYRLAAKSELPGVELFEGWIFDVVIPTVRNTGGFVANDDMFVNTYLPFADDTTKALFKATLKTTREQNEIIAKQKEELKKKDGIIEHKEDVIIALVDSISLAEKRQILNRVVRYKGADYQLRWRELYAQFNMKYHIDLYTRYKSYIASGKRPRITNKLDYVDRILDKIPELYDIACKLFENDVQELVDELYSIQAER